MKHHEIINTVNQFLLFIDSKDEQVDINKCLMEKLDSLGLMTSLCQYNFDENDYSDSPKVDYKEIRLIIENKFKDYGFYNTVEKIENDLSVTKLLVGDAIDDLTGIYIDLKEVQWKWENTSIDDALWCFENGYLTHWGWHLRNLQTYVYYKQS